MRSSRRLPQRLAFTGASLSLAGLVGAAFYRQPLDALRRVARFTVRIAGGFECRVELGDLPLRYFDIGKRSGVPIILVSGLGAFPEDWIWLILALSRRWHVLAPDLPGFGRTPTPDEGMGFSVLHNYFAHFLDALQVDQAVLVGNSLGGAVVARYAAHHPDRVRHLFLLDCAGVHGAIPAVLERTPEEMHRDTASTLGRRQPRFLLRDEIRRSQHSARQASLASSDITDITADLPLIEVPTTIIWGEDDRILPLRDGQRLQAGIRGSELLVLPGVGHAPQVAAPRRVLAILRDRLV